MIINKSEKNYIWPVKRVYFGNDLLYENIPESSDELAFEYDETAHPSGTLVYKLNNKQTYTASTSPYSATLTDLGIDEITTTFNMFMDTSLTKLTKFPDVSKLVSTYGMFSNCNKLTDVSIIANWKVEKLGETRWMFQNCKLLKEIPLDKWVCPDLRDISRMFQGCDSVSKLNLSGFNTSKCDNFEAIFQGCKSLVSLDISNWDMNLCERTDSMLFNCPALKTIIMNNCDCFTIQKVKDALAADRPSSQAPVEIISNTVCP